MPAHADEIVIISHSLLLLFCQSVGDGTGTDASLFKIFVNDVAARCTVPPQSPTVPAFPKLARSYQSPACRGTTKTWFIFHSPSPSRLWRVWTTRNTFLLDSITWCWCAALFITRKVNVLWRVLITNVHFAVCLSLSKAKACVLPREVFSTF